MAVSVTHAFVSALADDAADAAAGKVVPSNWNATHIVTNAVDKTGDTMTGALIIAADTDAQFKIDSESNGGDDDLTLVHHAFDLTNGPTGDENYTNDVWALGCNVSAVGVRADNARQYLALEYESKYYQGPSQMVPASEFHLATVDTNGTVHRPLSFFLPWGGGSGSSAGVSVDKWAVNNFANTAKVLFDWTTNAIDIYSGVVLRKANNDQVFAKQIDAAGTSYLSLPYFDSGDILRCESPVYFVGPRAGAAATVPGYFAVFQPTSINSGDTVLGAQTGQVTGNHYACQFTGEPTADYKFALYNNRGSSTSNAVIELRTVNSSAGDPFINFNVNGLGNFAIGVDNSDSDKFKICATSSLGSSTAQEIDSSLNTTFFGNVSSANPTNGQAIGIKSLTELLTIAAAATSTTTIQKPAHAIILGVSVRVTVAVTCTSTFTVGDSGDAARFSTAAVSKAANSTDKGTKAGAYYNATAEGIVITPDTVPSDATGRVRVTIHYLEVTPPTS